MTDAGRAAIDAAKANGWWTISDQVEDLEEPADLAIALDQDPQARANWDRFPPSARKQMLWWIVSAARPAMRASRIAAVIAEAAQADLGPAESHCHDRRYLITNGLCSHPDQQLRFATIGPLQPSQLELDNVDSSEITNRCAALPAGLGRARDNLGKQSPTSSPRGDSPRSVPRRSTTPDSLVTDDSSPKALDPAQLLLAPAQPSLNPVSCSVAIRTLIVHVPGRADLYCTKRGRSLLPGRCIQESRPWLDVEASAPPPPTGRHSIVG